MPDIPRTSQPIAPAKTPGSSAWSRSRLPGFGRRDDRGESLDLDPSGRAVGLQRSLQWKVRRRMAPPVTISSWAPFPCRSPLRMSTSPAPPARRTRWGLRFSLRLLLAAFTAFAVGFPIWYRWPYQETVEVNESLRQDPFAAPG